MSYWDIWQIIWQLLVLVGLWCIAAFLYDLSFCVMPQVTSGIAEEITEELRKQRG